MSGFKDLNKLRIYFQTHKKEIVPGVDRRWLMARPGGRTK